MAQTNGQAFGTVSQSVDASVIIVGAGFSGMAMAIALKKLGIDYLIVEKGADFGGTWRDNTYPGAACDVPSHMYSFSFEQYRWSRAFAPQGEIFDYQKKVARKYGLYQNVRFNSEVVGATYDEALVVWTVKLTSGDNLRARVLISARGALHIPTYPHIKGLDTFKGIKMHSAEWDHDVDLKGKRIAVVGTGASAIQIIPEMAKIADKLTIFQRTPAWVMPKPDFAYKEDTKDKLESRTFTRFIHRSTIYWRNEAFGTGFIVSPRIMKMAQFIAKRHIAKVRNPETRKALTPNYTMGCKRVLLSNNYYQAFNKPNVRLVPGAIDGITEHAVISNGVAHEVDAVIFCTGFDVTGAASAFNVVGKSGVSIHEHWKNGMHAYKGIATSTFPNAFFLLGPNTGLGHNSIIFMIESQVKYIAQALQYMQKKGFKELEVKVSREYEYNEALQQKMDKTVWNSGCASWYLDEHGKNTTLWPTYTFMYWLKTRFFDPEAYVGRLDAGRSSKNPIKRVIAKVS